MLHDTLLVIGFMGLSHWLVQYTPWLAKALLVEPFRINLTIVAAVLTVMSYSIIDTIVVFDRIRERLRRRTRERTASICRPVRDAASDSVTHGAVSSSASAIRAPWLSHG